MTIPLRVLLVEDSGDDADLLLHELRRGGYGPTFELVDTGEAMSAALDRQSWEVVIADYSMPRFSAPAALMLMKEKGLDLPFIIVSGTIGEAIAVAAMKSGAHDYLIKGQLARLVPAVERELREAEVRRARRRAEQALRELLAREQAARKAAEEAKNLEMQVEIDPSVGLVSGDPDRLQQVVWNLLSNAVKFTPAGGRVRVRLERARGVARITVSDTGLGIEPEMLLHIFERF